MLFFYNTTPFPLHHAFNSSLALLCILEQNTFWRVVFSILFYYFLSVPETASRLHFYLSGTSNSINLQHAGKTTPPPRTRRIQPGPSLYKCSAAERLTDSRRDHHGRSKCFRPPNYITLGFAASQNLRGPRQTPKPADSHSIDGRPATTSRHS